jgi:hypothetical protein
LHSDKLCDLYSSPKTIRVISVVEGDGRARDTNVVKISTRFWFESLKLRDRLQDVERRITLKRILELEAYTGLIWLRKRVWGERLWTW